MRKRSVIASLLIVLLLGTMAAAAWHHHDKSKIETCPACHLSKHALAPPPGGPAIGVSHVVVQYGASYGAPLLERVAFGRANFRALPA